MSASSSKSTPCVGFLTVLDQAEAGLFGGYLVLNAAGRPLEFHCTAPVKANRAQQILYGPTLAPYLYGEQIGQALLAKAKLDPLWICTDVRPALAVRDFTRFPVALALPTDRDVENAAVEGATPDDAARDNDDAGTNLDQRGDKPRGSNEAQLRLDAAHAAAPRPHAAGLLAFGLGGHTLAVEPSRDADRDAVVQRWSNFAELDLHEPFHRIREAIEEAQKAAVR